MASSIAGRNDWLTSIRCAAERCGKAASKNAPITMVRAPRRLIVFVLAVTSSFIWLSSALSLFTFASSQKVCHSAALTSVTTGVWSASSLVVVALDWGDSTREVGRNAGAGRGDLRF